MALIAIIRGIIEPKAIFMKKFENPVREFLFSSSFIYIYDLAEAVWRPRSTR